MKNQPFRTKHFLYLICFFTGCLAISQHAVARAQPEFQYVRIQVNGMEGIIRLYNATPKHRDNFASLVKEGAYDSLLFHRVIKGFMMQGGDPDSKNAPLGAELGEGDRPYTVPAEISDSLFHKKGVLAAARENNPEKRSSAMQFYLVQGKVYSDEELDRLEELRMKGRKIDSAKRRVYEEIGGTPFLDQEYTVFGELIQNVAMIDSVCNVPTDEHDRPLTDQIMQLSLLNKRESLELEAKLKGEVYRPSIFTRFLDLFR